MDLLIYNIPAPGPSSCILQRGRGERAGARARRQPDALKIADGWDVEGWKQTDMDVLSVSFLVVGFFFFLSPSHLFVRVPVGAALAVVVQRQPIHKICLLVHGVGMGQT